MFKSPVCLKLIFIWCDVWVDSCFRYAYLIVPVPFIEKTTFSALICLSIFVKISCPYMYQFIPSLFYSLMYLSQLTVYKMGDINKHPYFFIQIRLLNTKMN